MNDSLADTLKASPDDLYQITSVIADTASDAIITIDEQGTMLFANRAAEKIFGYSHAELIGQSLAMLMPDYLRHVHHANLQTSSAEGEKHVSWKAIELSGLHKDGREIPLELSLGEFTEDGRRFVTGIARDITERKRAQEERTQVFDRELRAKHEVETAIDRMARVQTVTDVALAHLSLDEMLAEMLNRVRDAMNVDTVAILLLDPNGDELLAWAAKGLEEEVELGIRVPVGAGFAGQVAASKSPVRIDDIESANVLNPILREKGIRSLLGVPLLVEGRVIGVIHVGKLTPYLFTEDDTRLLQLVADRIALAVDNTRLFEEERDARHEAEAASRAKDEFLTMLSHELRTPLTPIIGWIHMIRSGLVPEQEAEHGLSVIERNSHALKRLINDLLDMSAILSGKMRMEKLSVELRAALNEAVETVRPLAADGSIKLEVLFSNELDAVVVSGDRTRLVQVFWNLLHNAIKFSNQGDRVRVTCEANNGYAVVCVEDSGRGIAPEFLPHVFERFRQADGSKTRLFGGLGLGLALVKSFIEAHGGTISAESAGEGRGSRFTVRLPLQIDQLDSTTPGEREFITPKRGQLKHLLIIEDDADTLEMLRAAFDGPGFRVTACGSARDALAAAQDGSYDLIISDIGMPQIDGYELMRRLRDLPGLKNVPAIALTGYAAKKDAEMAIAAGFDAHVPKPADPLELTEMIDQLLVKAMANRD